MSEDKYMELLSKKYSNTELLEAGLTNINRCKRLYNIQNLLITPIHKILDTLENLLILNKNSDFKNKNFYVLVNTGCYDPIHIGHLHILEEAYNYFISKDDIVLGGYLIPSQTKYVTKKNKKDLFFSRLDKAQKFVKNHKWIMIDPFELLFEDDDICYTEILCRIEDYLKIHIGDKYNIKINVCYVFGGDRANFMRTFTFTGIGICVGRIGYDKLFNDIKEELCNCPNKNNLLWIERKLDFADISSTIIRNNNNNNINNTADTKKGIYYIINENLNINNYNYFVDNLFLIFQETFLNNTDITVKIIDIDIYNKIILSGCKNKTITINPLFVSDYYLKIIELYAYGDNDILKKIICNPKYLILKEQINLIPKGDYILLSDISTSKLTTEFIKNILNDNEIIIKENTLDDNIYYTINCEDYLLGFGGIFISLPNGEYAKVPCVLPYVYPSDKAKINVEENILFSKKIWKLNLNYYEKNNKLVKELNNYSKLFLNYIGFSDNSSLYSICKWHLDFFI
jgi:nicotinic acid mononucleotide adenylyltransferase